MPDWAAPLEGTFARIVSEIAGLGEDIGRVKSTIDEQVKTNALRTDQRIEELEKKVTEVQEEMPVPREQVREETNKFRKIDIPVPGKQFQEGIPAQEKKIRKTHQYLLFSTTAKIFRL